MLRDVAVAERAGAGSAGVFSANSARRVRARRADRAAGVHERYGEEVAAKIRERTEERERASHSPSSPTAMK